MEEVARGFPLQFRGPVKSDSSDLEGDFAGNKVRYGSNLKLENRSGASSLILWEISEGEGYGMVRRHEVFPEGVFHGDELPYGSRAITPRGA